MLAKNVTQSDLYEALRKTNEQYDNNITFRRIENRGKTVLFTLTVVDSRKEGHRCGFTHNRDGSRRKVCAACWHVHGHFFEHLLALNPEAKVVVSAPTGKRTIDTSGGNWQDRNIGSSMYPLYFSEACDC